MHRDDTHSAVNQKTTDYLARFSPEHPLANRNGIAKVHRLVLYAKIGPGAHPCHWCGATLFWTRRGIVPGALLTDHIDGNRRNNDPGNLVPSCNSCNTWRSRAISGDEPHITQQGRGGSITRVRATALTCEHCGVRFLAGNYRVRRANARFCSYSCAGKAYGGHANRRRGADNHNATLTEADVREMRRLWAAGGITLSALGAKFGVSKSGANMIVYRRSWKHVD